MINTVNFSPNFIIPCKKIGDAKTYVAYYVSQLLNFPEHRQYTLICPQQGNTNHTQDKAKAIQNKEDMQKACTSALLKSTENLNILFTPF